jgi:flagellar motor switch protein FliG
MKDTRRNLRKAAMLVASLDERNAEALLTQMTPAQAQAVRRAIESLGPIDAVEQQDVIEEFFRVGPLVPGKQPSGIELDDRLARRLSISQPSERISSESSNADLAPFRFLYEAPAHSLTPFLEREHPQTVAVVVSHLPAERAAEVLAGLSGELQIEVARRLIDLDEADPEILLEVEKGLETWLGQQMRGDQRRTAGLAALNNILDAATAQTRQHILANLARHDRQLAAQLKGPQTPDITFAEIERLDSAALSVVVRHASRELMVLALAGSGVGFAERVFELCEPVETAVLTEALRNLGPTRLSDVEQAQRELAELARQLEVRGEIAPNAGGLGRLSLAV